MPRWGYGPLGQAGAAAPQTGLPAPAIRTIGPVQQIQVLPVGNINSDIIPSTDSTYSLGSVGRRFLNVWAQFHYAHGPMPRVIWVEDDQAADEKRWDIIAENKELLLRTRNDGDTTGVTVWKVVRGAGTAVTSLDIPLSLVNLNGANPTLQFLAGAGNAPYIQHAANRLDVKGGTVGFAVLNNAGTASTLQITDSGIITFYQNAYFASDNLFDLGQAAANRVRTAYVGTSVITPLINTTGAVALVLGTNGVARWNVSATGHFVPQADATYDHGTSTTRARVIYVSASLDIGTAPSFMRIGTTHTSGPSINAANTSELALNGSIIRFFDRPSSVEYARFLSTGLTLFGAANQIIFPAAGGTIRCASGNINFMTASTNRWNVQNAGHWFAATDNAYDIGAVAANRPRAVYVAGVLQAGGLASLKLGVTVTGAKATLAASTTSYASVRLIPGTAPTTPADGDMWTDTVSAYVRINGATRNMIGGGFPEVLGYAGGL